MKKSKLSLGLIACLLSLGSLAGCDPVKSSDDGVLLSYTVDGTTKYKVADDILKEYYEDSDKYQAIFDAIFKVIKRNFFAKDRTKDCDKKTYNGVQIKLGKPQMTKINAEADKKVAIDKQTAQDNADANGTRYKKELEKILTEKGVKTVEELHEKYVGELQEETFDENFYNYFVDEMRGDNGAIDIALSNGKTFTWNGYLKDQSPYHMSHLMIELADSSDTNYADGKISKENAQNLYTAVNELRTTTSFKLAAYKLSDDDSSREKYGNLGIMDYDTSFINEFKLGIYAYEQFYLGKDATGRSIDASDFEGEYKAQVKETFKLANANDIPTVKYEVFESLNSFAEKESDTASKQVLEGNELVFPRNVMYNKYLNRHSVFFIEGDDTNEDTNGNFRTVASLGGKVLLCADNDDTKPIVAVRGSSGGKQEIHFMVVNRSPFGTYEVADKDYYTTYYYQQDMYPHKADGTKLETYTSFDGKEREDTESRANEVASKLKSFDSDKLNKYIFLKFMGIEKLTFEKDCKEIEKALMNWILTSAEKKENENKESWKKTWNEYIDKLSRQNSERTKLIPEVATKFFDQGNDKDTVLETVFPFANFALADYEGWLDEVKQAGGLLDANGNGEVTDAEVEAYWGATKIVDAFKKEGGVFNDGKEHI